MAGFADVHGEITGDGTRIFLIVVGPEFKVKNTAENISLLTPLISPIDTGNVAAAAELLLTWPAVVQLAWLLGPAWKPGPRLSAWVQEETQRRHNQIRYQFSRSVEGYEPRDYQIEGAALIAATGRALLFDDPGTGKTASTILGLAQRAAMGHRVWPAVVLCPASVVDSWCREFASWAPWLRVRAWRGAASTRAGLLNLPTEVYVASYDTARQDVIRGGKRGKPLLQVGARSVVADEVHVAKSASTGRSRAMVELAARAEQFVGLSGTPITHSPADLIPGLRALHPGAYPNRERWVGLLCTSIKGDYSETVLGLSKQGEPLFRMFLAGQQRRVSKADALPQLPPKVYSVREVELPEDWGKAYHAMEAKMITQLPDYDRDDPLASPEMSVMVVVALLTRLSQLACAAADVRTWEEEVVDPDTGLPEMKEHVEVTLRAPSWKVDALLEILDERPGHPVIATAPSAQLMRLAGEAAEKQGLRVGYVIGGQTPRERTAAIDAFQSGQLDLICVTTGAGGVGITLTAADTLVFLQRPWSIVESIQMEDRAHRIGSEKHESIEIIDIVAKGTIDTRRRAVLRERAGQLSDLLKDPES